MGRTGKKEVWLYSFLYRRFGYGFKIQTAKLLLDNRSMEEIRKEGKRNFLWKSVGIQEFYYRREYDKMNFLKLHLQPNQVLQLFFWIEESVYRFQPQNILLFF